MVCFLLLSFVCSFTIVRQKHFFIEAFSNKARNMVEEMMLQSCIGMQYRAIPCNFGEDEVANNFLFYLRSNNPKN